MTRPDETLIRDADLRAELEKARGNIIFETIARTLISRQERRDAQQVAEAKRTAELAAMPRDAARRAKMRDAIAESPAEAKNLRHIHSVLALCGLPYTRQPLDVREYHRKQGRMSLIVKAGELLSPTNDWVAQPLPYGSRARLLLLHLCSEAIRQKSPTINIEDSLTAFLRAMGFPATGGPRGTLTAFKQQVNALAACNMKIGTWDGAKATTINTSPFASIDVWFPTDPDQRMLWPSTITFSREFFDTLTKHALPVNTHAIRAFAGSPRKIDIYYWLSHRLHKLDAPATISWDALREQFGDGYGRERDFRAQFNEELAHLTEVFPRLPTKLGDKGLTLSPADASVLAVPARRSKKILVKQ
jgi:hypothetical protein